MRWSHAAADELLRAAFPWGALVTVESGSSFLSLRYEVLPGDFADDSALVRFERDPGDTIQVVRRDQLAAAATEGDVRFDSGAAARRPAAEDLALLTDPFGQFVGPQVDGETGWIARMRLHQSWWRTLRLRVPFGTGPRKGASNRYGNMLDETADHAGLNFLTPEARDAYDERWAASTVGIDPFRTRRHLMASQTLAFNLFGHLSRHLDLAGVAFSSILGEPVTVTSIEIERLSDALGDLTAFDAFACISTSNGPACVAIETKLTEPFSHCDYHWARYIEHDRYDPANWSTSDIALLGDRRWSQLWRNHMLGLAESHIHGLGPVHVLVVHHPLDPHCHANIEGYRALVTHQDRVQGVPLDPLVNALAPVVDASANRWLGDLRDRYLNLELSEPLTRLGQ